jgi:hypothetical protein
LLVRIGLVAKWRMLIKALKPLLHPQFLRESRKISFYQRGQVNEMETKTEVDIIPANASLLKAEQKRQRADRFYDGRFCFFSEG